MFLISFVGGKVKNVEKRGSGDKVYGFLTLAESSNKDRIQTYIDVPVFGDNIIDLINNKVSKGGKISVYGTASLYKPEGQDYPRLKFHDSKIEILDFIKDGDTKKTNDPVDSNEDDEFPF